MLQLKNVSKKFGETLVLNQINLSVQANEIIGIAGPSGSGKSTLLRCIQKLESIDSGHIQCNGQCGSMFQDFQLFPHFNVMNNLVYAPKIHNKKMNHEEEARVLLKKLGIADKALAYPHQLSGGQKQRVALARSLMMKPDLLLCDEPTSGLDVAATHEVSRLIHSVRDMKVTMIIASHDLAFLTRIADRLLVIKQGHLLADFRPADVTEPSSYIQNVYQGE